MDHILGVTLEGLDEGQMEYVRKVADTSKRYVSALAIERATVAVLRQRIKDAEGWGSTSCCDCCRCPWCGGRWDKATEKMRHESDCEAFTPEGVVK